MPHVTFIQPDGASATVEAADDATLMHVALRHAIPRIEAECGGQNICATCQVYVAPEWVAAAGPANADEEDMLHDLAVERRPESRLACQVRMSPALDGLVVHVPARQR